MEPVLGGRDDPPPAEVREPAPVKPQWSPSLADGTTRKPAMTCTAASRRNGARPWRTGRLTGGHGA